LRLDIRYFSPIAASRPKVKGKTSKQKSTHVHHGFHLHNYTKNHMINNHKSTYY
jgi:hypothetical protein